MIEHLHINILNFLPTYLKNDSACANQSIFRKSEYNYLDINNEQLWQIANNDKNLICNIR